MLLHDTYMKLHSKTNAVARPFILVKRGKRFLRRGVWARGMGRGPPRPPEALRK